MLIATLFPNWLTLSVLPTLVLITTLCASGWPFRRAQHPERHRLLWSLFFGNLIIGYLMLNYLMNIDLHLRDPFAKKVGLVDVELDRKSVV